MESLPQPLQFSPTSTENLQDQLRWVLCGHRIDVIELLRFPAIRSVLQEETPGTSEVPTPSLSQNSGENHRLASEFLYNAVQRIEISSEGFLHRHQGNWLTIRGCTRSALVLLGAKLRCQDQERQYWGNRWGVTDDPESPYLDAAGFALPPRWESAVFQVLHMLRIWEVESTDIRKLREIIETLLGFCQLGSCAT